MEALEHELDGRCDAGRRLPHLELGERRRAAPGRSERSLAYSDDRDVVAGVHHEPAVERVHDLGELLGLARGAEGLEHRRLDDAVEHLLLAAVVDRLELDLARGARRQRVEVAHPRGTTSSSPWRSAAARGVGDERLVVGDREPHRHARPLVDVRRAPGLLAHLGHDLGHERRARRTWTPVGHRRCAPPARRPPTSSSTSSG